MQSKILIGSDMGAYSVTDSTRNITITGLPFTLTTEQLAYIFNVTQDVLIHAPAEGINYATVSGGVITYSSDLDALATGDVLHIQVWAPMLAYDEATDSQLNYVINPNYAHYTSVEHLISTSDLGITATADGTDADTLNDANGAFDAENVAVGYEAYSEEEDATATVLSITDASNIETDAITDWTGDTYWLPECQRYVIPAEGYNFLSVHVRISTDDATNVAYCKIYATLDEDADDTDDTYWVDISSDVFGAAQLSATNDTTEGLYFIDTPTTVLKYMVKIVAEVIDGGGSAAAGNDFDVYIKKSS